MSGDDQHKFNEEYRKWQESMAKNDRDDVGKHAGKMQEIMARYNIPQGTPFDPIATTNGYSRHYDYRDFQERSSAEDQEKFRTDNEPSRLDRIHNNRNASAQNPFQNQHI